MFLLFLSMFHCNFSNQSVIIIHTAWDQSITYIELLGWFYGTTIFLGYIMLKSNRRIWIGKTDTGMSGMCSVMAYQSFLGYYMPKFGFTIIFRTKIYLQNYLNQVKTSYSVTILMFQDQIHLINVFRQNIAHNHIRHYHKLI